MSATKKYGNSEYWLYDEGNLRSGEVAVWKGTVDGSGENGIVVARAIDTYEAKKIVDALISYTNSSNNVLLDKKAVTFLEFVAAKCKEPYSTMAHNAIMWNDVESYNTLISTFPDIY
jgi:hypothetical protein